MNLKTLVVALIVLTTATILSPHTASAQQEQSFAEANDIVLSNIAGCAQQGVTASAPNATETVFDGTATSFWGCIYADGWPGNDVPDYRLDRPMRVVQSTIEEINDALIVVLNLTITLGVEAELHPDESDQLIQWLEQWSEWVQCLGWATIQANAHASMSEQGRADNPGLAPRPWACGQQPILAANGRLLKPTKMLPPSLRSTELRRPVR